MSCLAKIASHAEQMYLMGVVIEPDMFAEFEMRIAYESGQPGVGDEDYRKSAMSCGSERSKFGKKVAWPYCR